MQLRALRLGVYAKSQMASEPFRGSMHHRTQGLSIIQPVFRICRFWFVLSSIYRGAKRTQSCLLKVASTKSRTCRGSQMAFPSPLWHHHAVIASSWLGMVRNIRSPQTNDPLIFWANHYGAIKSPDNGQVWLWLSRNYAYQQVIRNFTEKDVDVCLTKFGFDTESPGVVG